MRKLIRDLIKNSAIIKWFIKEPMPSWLVLYVDLLWVYIAGVLTFYFNQDTTSGEIGMLYAPWAKALIFAGLLFFAMFFNRSYKSIIRLSAFEDTYRLFGAIFSTAIFALIVDWVGERTAGFHYFGSWNIMTISFISFALLVSTRIVIKYIFTIASSSNSKRRRVAVLGSAINSYALAKALQNEVDGAFEPVLLLSRSNKYKDVQAGSFPIRMYDPETVESIFKEFNCDTLIFLSTQIDFIRQEAGDVFLRNDIKLLMLNQVEEFNVTDSDSPILSPHVQNIRIEDLLGRPPIVTETKHIKERLYGQTVMITGAAGSIGSEIVRQVATFGAGTIVLVDQAETPMHEMQLEMEHNFPDIEIKLCIGDVANLNRMESLFRDFNPNIVYHAAAYKHVPMMECNPGEAANTNILGTKNLADLALKYGVQKFVMISTDKAVNPTNIMGASKRVAEIYVQSLANHIRASKDDKKQTRFITTRFGNVLGSNGSVIPLFQRQIEEGGPVTVTHRDIIRYFMTIPEACSLVLEAGCMGHGGEIFIFDMGKPVRIYDLATRMISLAGLRPNKDIKIVETGLRPGEKLYEELLNNRETTIATHHKKIMIAKVRQYDYAEVCQHIKNLTKAVEINDMHEIVAEIKRIVPEFISQNSKWGAVDNEVSEKERIDEIIAEAPAN